MSRSRADRTAAVDTRPVRLSRRRVLTVSLAMALAVLALTAIGTTSLSPFHGPSVAGATPTCTSDGTSGCTTTLPCSTSPCPSVDISPATSLSDGQYVFVKASNFPSGDTMRVALCSTITSVTDPSCLTGVWESNDWGPVQVPITVDATNDNLTQVAVPAFFDEQGEGNDPLPAHDITNVEGPVPGFFCDNSANLCALEVTEEVGVGNSVGDGPPDSSANTMIVPLNFAAQNAGCPPSDTQVQTDSSFSLEHFLPAAVDATCAGSNGVVALNTATDNKTVSSDFASDGVDVGFVDDPGDPTDEGTLYAGQQFAYIPVAVSGTSVSFLAGESDARGTAFPVSEYNLTPNMVAGLITSDYQTATGTVEPFSPFSFEHADNLAPPLECSNLLGCPGTKAGVAAQHTFELADSSFDLLNPVSSGNYGPYQFGSFDSNVPNGSSYQASDWLCNAPNTPFPVSVNEVTPPKGESNPVSVNVTDHNLASKTLVTAPEGSSVWPPPDDPDEAWVFSSCQAYSTFPALAGSASDYGEFQSPALQAKSIRSYAYAGGSVPVLAGGSYTQMPAGFGVMDSSEAAYYGLNTASIQNAAGNFEAPTVATLEAAEANLSPCPADNLSCPTGTFAVSYTSTANPTAYPMPDVTYAVVPTTPQTPAKAAAIKDLLTNLVDFSHSGGSLALPSGYAPLSDTLYQAAITDISKDVVAEPSPATTTTTTPTKSSSQTTTTATSTGTGSSGGGNGGSTGDDTSGSGQGSLPLSTPAGSGGSGSHPANSGGVGVAAAAAPTGLLLVGLDEVSRFLLPAIVALALACLIVGPFLLLAPAIRRRRRGAGGST
jgi:hypothetical protein